MKEKGKLLYIALLLAALFAMISIIGWLSLNRENNISVQQTNIAKILPTLNANDPKSEVTVDPMEQLYQIATLTAQALLGTSVPMGTPIPSATLPPNTKYWYPLGADAFTPRLTYNDTQWAVTDIRTLASLQISGCALRLASGRTLGPGWTTEEGAFQTDELLFTSILAKREGLPQFITYSLENGAVFEIASESDFVQCQQSGEAILKTIETP